MWEDEERKKAQDSDEDVAPITSLLSRNTPSSHQFGPVSSPLFIALLVGPRERSQRAPRNLAFWGVWPNNKVLMPSANYTSFVSQFFFIFTFLQPLSCSSGWFFPFPSDTQQKLMSQVDTVLLIKKLIFQIAFNCLKFKLFIFKESKKGPRKCAIYYHMH